MVWLTFKPKLALSVFPAILPCFQQVNLTWAGDPNVNNNNEKAAARNKIAHERCKLVQIKFFAADIII